MNVNGYEKEHTVENEKKINKHITVKYLSPYIGNLYADRIIINMLNKDDKDGEVNALASGDFVEWTKKMCQRTMSG